MTAITLTRLIELLVLPPCGPLLLAVVGLVLLNRYRRTAYGIMISALAMLYCVSIPFFSQLLIAGLEPKAPLSERQLVSKQPAAIVVLAGPDGYWNAPEYAGQDMPGAHMLQRLRYAAYLHHKTKMPVAVIGGDGLGRGTPAAQYMRQVLVNDFKVSVQWAHGESKHTFDNARYTKEVLSAVGINKVYLVTHGWHMRRAQQAFVAQGLDVIAAPVAFATHNQLGEGVFAFVPRVQAMELSNRALHEWIGLTLSGLFE